jgi:hypothetical protein
MMPVNFRYPYYFPVKKVNDTSDLQQEIVQNVIRTNNRLKLSKILRFVNEELKQE